MDLNAVKANVHALNRDIEQASHTLSSADLLRLGEQHGWDIRPGKGSQQRLCRKGYRNIYISSEHNPQDSRAILQAIYRPVLDEIVQASYEAIEPHIQHVLEELSPNLFAQQTEMAATLKTRQQLLLSELEQRQQQHEREYVASIEQRVKDRMAKERAHLVAEFEQEFSINAEIQQLKKELEAAIATNVALEDERRTLEWQLEHQVETFQAHSEDFAEQLEAKERALELAQAQLHATKELHQTTVAELLVLQEQISDQKHQREQLDTQMASAEATLNELSANKAELTAQLCDRDAQFQTQHDQISTLTQEIETLRSQIEALAGDKVALDTEAHTLRHQLSEAEATVLTLSNLQHELESVKTNCLSLASTNQELQVTSTNLQTQLHDSQSAYDQSEQVSHERQQAYLASQIELEQVQQAHQHLVAANAELQSEVERWRNYIQKDNRELLPRIRALNETAAPELHGVKRVIFGMGLALVIMGLGWVTHLLPPPKPVEGIHP